jgi:uncharacterized protein (TIGR02001 family)
MILLRGTEPAKQDVPNFISGETTVRKLFIASAVASAFALPATPLLAADAPAAAPAAPKSPWTITTNVYGVSDYYFRGITQTWHKPAIQGGADVAHDNGFYAGVWGSNVSNNTYPGGSALEFDYYGGYNGKFNDDWGWTVGGHGYAYPGANFNKSFFCGGATCGDSKFDSFEWNVGANYKFVSVKYSQMITNWFGVSQDMKVNGAPLFSSDSKGSSYLEANVAYEFVPTWTLNLHAAHTKVRTTTTAAFGTAGLDPSYSDYLLGVTKGFDGGWAVSLAYAKSHYKSSAYWKPTFSFANTDSLSDPGDGRLILSAGRTF